jgi:plastocyanin
VADPEQIYSEVLAEEQGKGVTAAVAEARAKAARARAEAGSPHPKDPKWWPGAQPHLEGGGGEAEAEPEAAEEPAAEEEATAEVQADEVEQEPAPAATPEPVTEEPVAPAAAGATETAPETAPAPAAQQPAAAAAQPAAAATATAVQDVPPKTTGVSHGTATGTRLRPEDEVSTEAQFEGQKAMYERRKLIDELVATGVPAVSADDTDRSRGPWLAVLYLLIPLLVVFYLATNEEEPAAEPTGGDVTSEAPANGGGGGGPTTEIVAADIAWSEDAITLTADEPNSLDVVNDDSTVHNLSIYETPEDAESQSNPLFEGPDVAAGATESYEIDPLKAGEYTYICDYHINMVGTATVE